MEEESGKRMRGRSRGRTRGRGRGRGRGRAKKAVKVIESDEEETPQTCDDTTMDVSCESENAETETQQTHQTPQQPSLQTNLQPIQPTIPEQQFDLEADISQLEAPTFTTINRGPPEPMLRLRWDHRVNLIGEKVLNPMIHCCDKCSKPVLMYGRMIPCKHVFCLSCAKREDKVCPRCMEKVVRVEQTGLGTVFMCTHGGTRYGNDGCRRTYLSQRDLQAHINHRHVSASVQGMQVDPAQYAHSKAEMETQLPKIPPNAMQSNRIKAVQIQPIMGNDPRVNSMANQQAMDHRAQHRSQTMLSMQGYSQNSAPPPSNNPMRTNLITVPIQDTTMSSHEVHSQQGHHYYPPPPQTHTQQVNYGGYNVPPPVTQNQQYYNQSQHQQVSYAPPPTQQQYVPSGQSSMRAAPSGYIQESQYGPPPQQQLPPPQQQWGQHQQQFYR